MMILSSQFIVHGCRDSPYAALHDFFHIQFELKCWCPAKFLHFGISWINFWQDISNTHYPWCVISIKLSWRGELGKAVPLYVSLWQNLSSSLLCLMSCCFFVVEANDNDVRPSRLLGVRLACDMHLDDRAFDTCLGVIVLRRNADVTLPTVRHEISLQLSIDVNSFVFLTGQGLVFKFICYFGNYNNINKNAHKLWD